MNCNECGACKTKIKTNSTPPIPASISEYDALVKDITESAPQGPSIIINLTNECPLRCVYCFVEFEPKDISLETICTFFDNLLAGKYQFDKNKKLPVSFFGGEPMMKFDEIIVPVVEKYGDAFHWGMTTNGVLLTEERLQFMKHHNFNILLSIDGAPKTQDINRPFKDGSKSSEVLEQIIPPLLEHFPRTCFRSTLIPKTVNNLGENIAYAEAKGFRSFFVVPNEYEAWQEQELEDVAKTIGAYYMTSFFNGCMPMSFSTLDTMLRHLVDKSGQPNVHNKVLSPLRCGLGITGMGITVEGNLVACQEKASLKDSIFIIGDLNGINKEKHLKLLTTFKEQTEASLNSQEAEKCETCICRSFCIGNTCPSRQIDVGGRFSPIVEIASCVFKQKLYEVALGIDAMTATVPSLTNRYIEYLGRGV